MSGFSSMDKNKKIVVIVSSVALVIAAVFIINFVSGGAVQEIVIPVKKPEPPKMEPAQNETYKRQRQKAEEREKAGEATTAGS